MDRSMDEEKSKQSAATDQPVKADKPKKKRKKIQHLGRKIFFGILLTLVVAIGGFMGYMTVRAKYTTVYQGYKVSSGSISDDLEYSSSFRLMDSYTYVAESDSKVRAIYVAEGDSVTKGQRLMRLSSGQTVTADIDGKVNTISVKVNDEVTAETQLIQIADFSRLMVRFTFSEYDVPKVKVGTEVQVVTTATKQTFNAKVTSVDYSSTSRGSIAYYTGKLEINVTEGLYPGMQVKVKVPQTLASDTLILSTDALSFDDSNKPYVFVKQEDGSMTEKYVTLGEKNDDYVQITDGLTAGDTVYAKQETETTTASLFGSMLSGLGGGQSGGSSNRPSGNWPSGGGSGNWSGGSRSGSGSGSGSSGGWSGNR